MSQLRRLYPERYSSVSLRVGSSRSYSSSARLWALLISSSATWPRKHAPFVRPPNKSVRWMIMILKLLLSGSGDSRIDGDRESDIKCVKWQAKAPICRLVTDVVLHGRLRSDALADMELLVVYSGSPSLTGFLKAAFLEGCFEKGCHHLMVSQCRSLPGLNKAARSGGRESCNTTGSIGVDSSLTACPGISIPRWVLVFSYRVF